MTWALHQARAESGGSGPPYLGSFTPIQPQRPAGLPAADPGDTHHPLRRSFSPLEHLRFSHYQKQMSFQSPHHKRGGATGGAFSSPFRLVPGTREAGTPAGDLTQLLLQGRLDPRGAVLPARHELLHPLGCPQPPAEADIQDRHIREDTADGQGGPELSGPEPLLLLGRGLRVRSLRGCEEASFGPGPSSDPRNPCSQCRAVWDLLLGSSALRPRVPSTSSCSKLLSPSSSINIRVGGPRPFAKLHKVLGAET